MILLVTAWMLAAAPAAAQMEVGTGFGPESFLQGERVARESMPILPLALATSLAFDATTWMTVAVSTVPARELSAMIKKGYYKLELLQTVLLASRAKAPLKDIAAAHDKGKSLRELAKDKAVDFDALYEEALRLDRELIDRLLPGIMTVSSGPPQAVVPQARPKFKPKPRPEKKP